MDEDNIYQVRLIAEITRWVVEQMKPFSVVEAKAFIRMLKSDTLGQYNEISAHTLSCRAIPKIYKFMKKQFSDLLNEEKDGLDYLNIRYLGCQNISFLHKLDGTLPRQKFPPEKIPFRDEVFSRGPYGK